MSISLSSRLAGLSSLRSASSVSAPVVPGEVEVPAQPELSLNLQVALLSISSRPRARALWLSKIKGLPGFPKPMLSDYQQLAGLALATRPTTGRWHCATAEGENRAETIALSIAHERGLHASWVNDSGYAWWTMHCVCGWSCGLRKGQDSSALAFSRHLSHVRVTAGMADLAKALTPPSVRLRA